MARKGEPKTGGRVAGTPNRSTAAIKEMAAEYGPMALTEIARLATGAESEQVRVSACKEVLDRAYGKSLLSRDPIDDHRADDEEVSDLEIARRVAYLLTNAVDKSMLKDPERL